MAVFVLEDLAAAVEVMVFPKTMTDHGHKLADDVGRRPEGPARHPRRQAQAHRHGDRAARGHRAATPRRCGCGCRRSCCRRPRSAELKRLLVEHPGDSPVYLHLSADQVLRLPATWNVDAGTGLIGELRVLLGPSAIRKAS